MSFPEPKWCAGCRDELSAESIAAMRGWHLTGRRSRLGDFCVKCIREHDREQDTGSSDLHPLTRTLISMRVDANAWITSFNEACGRIRERELNSRSSPWAVSR